MNADAFRQFYAYHFAENRKIWDSFITSLTPEQFTQPISYAHGSVQRQIIHLINVDNAWFSDLRGLEGADDLDAAVTDRETIRRYWDQVEQNMRDYLASVHDTMLFEKPFVDGEDKDLILWQVLLHVVNHGTDHRAQLLRCLSDFGLKTTAQDYIFYVYDHP
jgi:uncharacterized damage-inducible protein DinB